MRLENPLCLVAEHKVRHNFLVHLDWRPRLVPKHKAPLTLLGVGRFRDGRIFEERQSCHGPGELRVIHRIFRCDAPGFAGGRKPVSLGLSVSFWQFNYYHTACESATH